jgi:hypothetical protein
MKLSSPVAAIIPYLAVSLMTVLGFSGQAQAFRFSGSSAGTWGNPTPEKVNPDYPNAPIRPIFTGVGGNRFTWGEPGVRFANGQISVANWMEFDGISNFETKTNNLFKVGSLTYFNGTTPLGTNVDSVPLNFSVLFNNPTNERKNFDFQFQLVNTPNLGTAEQNADFVFVKQNIRNQTFEVDGRKFALQITGFRQEQNILNQSVNEFRVLEGATTTASIYGTIVSVPEPATLTGISLLGAYLIYRRKSSRIKK